MREVTNGTANPKLRLFLQGIEIPGLASSIIVPDNVMELRRKANQKQLEVVACEAKVKGAGNYPPQPDQAALEKAKNESQTAEALAKKAEEDDGLDLWIKVERFTEDDASRKAWDEIFRSSKCRVSR